MTGLTGQDRVDEWVHELPIHTRVLETIDNPTERAEFVAYLMRDHVYNLGISPLPTEIGLPVEVGQEGDYLIWRARYALHRKGRYD